MVKGLPEPTAMRFVTLDQYDGTAWRAGNDSVADAEDDLFQRIGSQVGASREGADVEVFGRYCDRFEKRDGAWRVARRKVVYDGTRTQPSTHHLRKLVGAMGRRDRSDPVYALTDPNRGQEGRR